MQIPVCRQVEMRIEIKGFLETSFVDWPGKICSVLFLPYCNFRCPYCHNHPLVFHPEQYLTVPFKDILARLRAFEGWIDGVCLTGGEPTFHADLPSLIREIKRHGFLVKLDTNGSNPEMLENLIEAREIDFVSMDVKAPLDPFSYHRSTGLSIDINAILRSIEILKRGEAEHEFRMTVVPGLHQKEDIQNLGSQLRAGKRFVLQNFNPENPLDPSLKNILPYDPKVLKEMEREVQKMV
jgi:pyruvate formate lyase activating enzyme